MADELTLESLKARWNERDKLIDVWADRLIDDMDTKSLAQLAREYLVMGMDDLSPAELLEDLDGVNISWRDLS